MLLPPSVPPLAWTVAILADKSICLKLLFGSLQLPVSIGCICNTLVLSNTYANGNENYIAGQNCFIQCS